MNVTLSLSTDSAELESDCAVSNTLSQSIQRLNTHILKRMLETGLKVWNKLGDTSVGSDLSRNTLGNEKSVTLRKVTASCGVVTSLLGLHSIDRAHTTVSLDELSFSGNEELSGRLGGTSQKTTHHDGRSTKSKTLQDVTDVLDTAISDARNTELGSELGD